MKWILSLGVCFFFSFPAFAKPPQFNLQLEDGGLNQQCTAKPRPGGGPDWMVQCGSQLFAVHLLVNKYPVANDQFRYQILYWVLDYNDRPDSSLAGTYHGTNITLNLPQDGPAQTIRMDQMVQTVWNLEVAISL